VNQQGTAIALHIEGIDQVVWAEPRPEDEGRLAELLGGGPLSVELAQADEDDTEGHELANELVLDVEGHAIAVRLPTGADAAALRRGFAAGVVTASLVIGGAAAAIAGADAISQAAAQPADPAAPAVVSAPAEGDANRPQSPKQYE
jgi:hypothetical protein